MSNFFKLSLFSLCFAIFTNNAADAVDIADTESTNVSTLSTADPVVFTGTETGTLTIDGVKTLASITATNNGIGTVDFTTASTLTISGDVGASGTKIAAITFNEDGVLNLKGDLYSTSVSTTRTNEGSLILSGAVSQTISSSLGSTDSLLKSVSITHANGTVFNDDVFATTLTTSTDGVAISGTGALTISASNITDNTTISSSGAVSLGTTTITSAKALTLDTNATMGNIITDSGSSIVVNTGKTATITGSISITSGAASIVGDADNKGNLLFSGILAQTVDAGVTLGSSSLYLNQISTSNIHADGVTLNDDVYATIIDFIDSSASESIISIASGKTINLEQDINESNAGTGVIKGAGKLNLNGTTAQTISAALGASTSDTLGELEINNTVGVTLADSAYVTTLTSSTADSILVVNSLLDASVSTVTESLTISGSGSISLGATSVADSKILTLSSNTTLDSLATNTSGTTTIASGKTATITGDITGTGTLQGSATTKGNILFSGSSAQAVAAKLGGSSNYLNTLSFSNIAGVTFNDDIYATTLNFTNAAGEVAVSLASSAILDITGNISQTGAGTSVITGTSGQIELTGSSEQNIYVGLGNSGTRLGTVNVNNAAGVVFHEDSFLTTLTLSNGAFRVAANKTIDVTNAIDLRDKTFTSSTNGAAFGKVKSGGTINVNSGTEFAFDYSNNLVDLDYSGATEYVIADGTSISISGSFSDVQVSDNSFLFDNSLGIAGNDVVTTVSASSHFTEATLGREDYTVINNALQYAGLTGEIISLSSQAEVAESVDTLKPVTNAATTIASFTATNNSTNITNLHLRNLNATITGFSTGDETATSTNRVWAQAFGGGANQGQRDSVDGFKSRIGGLIFGADKLIEADKSDITLGAAFSYSASAIEGASASNNDTTINSYQLILYNNNADYSGLGFYNNNIINLAYNDYKTQRTIAVGDYLGTARGKFAGNSYSIKSGVGYRIKLSDNFMLSPTAALQYYKLSQDSYQETGAGNAGLNVVNNDYDNIISEIGVELTSKVKTKSYDLTPKFSAAWSRNLKDNSQESTVSFIGGGAKLQNDSIVPQEDRFNFGFGLDVVHSKYQDQSLRLVYDLQLASQYDGHLGSIEYSKSF